MTTLTPETIASRAKQAPQMDGIMAKLKLHEQREHLIMRIGGSDETSARELATQHFRKAGIADITAILKGLEALHGKAYRQVKDADGKPIRDYAGIPEALHQRGATHAELEEWDRIMRETVYMKGGKFQPLPSHPEALQAFNAARTECGPLYSVAAVIRNPKAAAPYISDEELIVAARFGFWYSMVVTLKKRLYQLMPKEVKDDIYSKWRGQQAMDATQKYWEKL